MCSCVNFKKMHPSLFSETAEMGAWGRNVLIIQEGLMLGEPNSASSPRLCVFFFHGRSKTEKFAFF